MPLDDDAASRPSDADPSPPAQQSLIDGIYDQDERSLFDQDDFEGTDRASRQPGAERHEGAETQAPNPKHRRRVRRWLLVSACVVVLVIVAGVIWFEIQSHAGPPGRTAVVTVQDGASLDSVVSQLQDKGVISSALAFHVYLFFHGSPTVEPGSYAVKQNLGFASVRQILAGGPNIYPLSVPAGFTLSELADRVADLPGHTASSFLNEARSGSVRSPFEETTSNNLEGLLGTGTYDVLPQESDRQLLQDMVSRFDQQAASAGVTPTNASLHGVTLYQMIVIASIVQKEAFGSDYVGGPKNAGPVARVIYNRLDRGMPLQMDSTILYSLGKDGGTVTSADLQLDTPYNTYLHTGLPPTPIDFPSLLALHAAAHPPAGPWLYFEVVSQDGAEAFSSTFSQQLANEALAARHGL